MTTSSAAPALGVLYNPYTQTLTAVLFNSLEQGVNSSLAANGSAQSQISNYGLLQSTLSSLQVAAQDLSGQGSFSLGTASVNPLGVLSASASAAATGSYTVNVTQLAQGQTLLSGSEASPNTLIGSGSPTTLTFTFAGGTTQKLSIASPDNTLAGLETAINAAQLGINASLATTGSGYQLVLNGPTGSTNGFSVSASGDATLGTFLQYQLGASNNGLQLLDSAQNALGSLSGQTFSAPSNTLTNIANGLNLALNSVGTATLTVIPNTAQASTNLRTMVNAYNSMQSLLQSDLSGTLASDSSLSNLQGQLANIVSSNQSSNPAPYTQPTQIGLALSSNGQLNFNSTAFEAAYTANPASVTQMISNPVTGIASQLSALSQSYLQPNGTFAIQSQQLQLQNLLNQEAQNAATLTSTFANLAYSASAANLTNQYSMISQL